MNDYYYVLGISRKANQTEIKTAYRKLSKKFHPDLNGGDKFFEDRFKEIQTAYETLTNISRKTRYDRFLNNFSNTNNYQSYNQNSYSKTKKEKQEKPEEKKEEFNISNSKLFVYLVIGFIIIFGLIKTFDTKNKKTFERESIQSIDKPLENNIKKNIIESEAKPINSISESNERWLNGNYSGIIKQFDINQKWKINLEIGERIDFFGEKIINTFKVNYPSLKCNGNWNIISQKNNKLEFRETIEKGKDICNNSGKVVIEKKGNQIIYSYYFPNDKTLNASGKLKYVNKNKYIGNKLKNGTSPLDKCFGKGKYSGKAYLIFKNSNRTDAIVCLVRRYDNKTIRNEYIRAGSNFEMSKIPSGNYFIKVYYGNDWNPEKINFCGINGAFENNVHFSKSDNIGDIIKVENSLNGYTTGSITLYAVENGNMSSENINESEFFD
ncbi:J domain-containing protein [Tenacibaculum soleae]|uniref:J domain-containing protein n=1 Tax=Tenacibaculum soleae TaxID=447689 RepID=UPI003AB1A898